MKTYKCPVCGSALSKEHYEHALGIVEAQKKALNAERLQISKERAQLGARITEAKAAAEKKALGKTQRLVQGKDKMIESLKQTVRQLREGTTPQTDGLEFEDTLTSRLKREFPSDLIEHKGKSGDILHTVFDGRERCGLIVYELKRTKFVQTDHVRQAAQAQRSRGADIAVLVTTGSRRGFNGFSTMDGVPIVAPQGVIALVAILREHLIQMHRASLSKEQREVIAKNMMEFLTGAAFKNHLEGIVQAARQLQQQIKAEAQAHMKTWVERWKCYESISWDSGQIKANVALVLQGKEPQSLPQPRFQPPLLLPSS
jgi:hypothetical protein